MNDDQQEPQTDSKPTYEGWAIVEIMGHRQTAGLVREVLLAGTTLLRVDTPGSDGEMVATQFYGGAAIYCLTPCDRATAVSALADAYNLPEPVRLAIVQRDRGLSPALPFDPHSSDYEEDTEP